MSTNFPTSLDTFPTQADLANDTLATKAHSNLHANLGDSVAALESKVGVDGLTFASTSVEGRLKRLEGMAHLDARVLGVVADDATDCTTALQTAVDFVGGLGGGVVELPGGIIRHDTIDVGNDNVIIRGKGIGRTTLRYVGSGAGEPAIKFEGTEIGDYTGCLEHTGLQYLTMYNSGTGASVGRYSHASRDHVDEFVAYTGFRAGAVVGHDYWNFTHLRNSYDFCGSVNDTDVAVQIYSGTASGEWAVDAGAEIHARFENNGDRILDCRPANGHLVNKIAFIGGKIEESSGQMGGNSTDGCAFYLENVGDFTMTGTNIVLQDKRAAHAVIPYMFQLVDCNGIDLRPYIAFGSGSMPKCFNYFFRIDGGQGFNIAARMTCGNTTAYPTTVFNFANTPVRLNRVGTTWCYAPGSPPTTDTGTVPSGTTW